ncbi:conserved hypothetical protein [Culex quinquefasciatus]|uniref:Uncharacterized protein n=1 Tax=Culex quinquefasciatus TaxID=7176 RepID=B0XLN8_CULQU|nr:conserved hypothetical protein [Culex quinquefasciatus]|eukprot:XP_001870560.1 conserved hypothetical protein [Culex quinquefasciatus]
MASLSIPKAPKKRSNQSQTRHALLDLRRQAIQLERQRQVLYELVQQLERSPSEKAFAVQEGAIELLKELRHSPDPAIVDSARLGLTLLGALLGRLSAAKIDEILSKHSRKVAFIAKVSWQLLLTLTGAAPASTHTILSDLLPPGRYFRFNPYLTEFLSMVEVRPEKIAQLERDTNEYFKRNEDKFELVAELLTRKRNIVHQTYDALRDAFR